MSFLRRLTGATTLAALAGCAQAGTPAAGFTLTSDRSAAWSLAGQHRPVVLTFGFTHCADTCPATLAKLADLARNLGARGEGLEIAMVSVDPGRDTPAVLHRFVARFDRPVVGLTGTPAGVRAVEKAYGVWAVALPKRRDGSYDVDHTESIAFIDRNGRLRAVHDGNDPDATLRQAMAQIAG